MGKDTLEYWIPDWICDTMIGMIRAASFRHLLKLLQASINNSVRKGGIKEANDKKSSKKIKATRIFKI